ncbi:hypothetical protein OAF94_00975 [bacterium]|nr:hypothetical protein [bacterium]
MVVENFAAGSIPNKNWSTNTQTGGGLQQLARQPAFLGIYDRDPADNTANFQSAPDQSSRIGIRVRGAFSSKLMKALYCRGMSSPEPETFGEVDWIRFGPAV